MWRWHSSEQRMPVEYSVITMVRRIRFCAESIRASQSLDVEKTQSCSAAGYRPCLKLAFSKQIGLILPDMIRPQPVWRAGKIPGKLFYRVQVGEARVL